MLTPKERPILFSAAMVLAILSGKKTQTRRVLKNPHYYGCPTGDCPHGLQSECDQAMNAPDILSECPYGKAGDRLWVRESWQYVSSSGHPILCLIDGQDEPATYPEQAFSFHRVGNGSVIYTADLDECGQYPMERKDQEPLWVTPKDDWRPSIHMPRWASRIALEVVSVKIERLSQISDKDARSEGFPFHPLDASPLAALDPVQWFSALWDSINGKTYPWKSDPWVWVVEFRQVTE